MPAKILQQKQIGDQNIYYLSGCEFSKNGIQFKVTATEKTGAGIYDTIHTVKNVVACTYASISMMKLIQILKDCE